jgi:hypothetical protein
MILLENYASHCSGETIDGAGSISCRGLTASEDVAHLASVCLVFRGVAGNGCWQQVRLGRMLAA